MNVQEKNTSIRSDAVNKLQVRVTAAGPRNLQPSLRAIGVDNIPCRSTTVATDVNKRNKRGFLPRIFCLNARSLNKKIDELAAFMTINKVHQSLSHGFVITLRRTKCQLVVLWSIPRTGCNVVAEVSLSWISFQQSAAWI